MTSSVSDAVNITSKGRVRPWKSTALGLGIGTLTGSKAVLQILNRLGHSVCYEEIKGLETEFAFPISHEHHETQDGMLLTDTRGTGIAWDNYNVNIETLDGKDTLHATIGICHQNKAPDDNVSTDIELHDKRKRRRFEGA